MHSSVILEKFELIWYFLVGIVKGIALPFPIDSNAQVQIATKILKLREYSEVIKTDEGLNTLYFVLILGGLVALVLKFLPIIKTDLLESNEGNLKINVLVSGATTGLIYLLFKSYIIEFNSSKYALVTMIIFMFIIMIPVVLTLNYLSGNKQTKDITIVDAVITGVLNSFGFILGFSGLAFAILYLKIKKISITSSIKFYFLSFILALSLQLLIMIPSISFSNLVSIQMFLALIGSFVGVYSTFRIFISMAKRKTLRYISSWLCLLCGLAVIAFLVG